MKGGT
ncbi:hypothetical protein D046_5926A, partial [Vibrio parahaemolyticus V-223/04]